MTDTTTRPARKPAKNTKANGMDVMVRNITAVVQAIIMGLILWVGNSILEIRQDIATLKERNSNQAGMLASVITRLDDNTNLRYRSTDAVRDFSDTHKRIFENERRITRLEALVNLK